MHRTILMVLIPLLFAATICRANDDDDSSFFYRSVFEEGFESSFPPSGWSLAPDDGNPWHRETPGAGDGWGALEGIRSACADGNGGSGGRLITGRIDLAGEGVGFDEQNLTLSFMALSMESDGFYSLTVEASTEPPARADWTPLTRTYDFGGDDDDADDDFEEADWVFADVDIQPYMDEASIWLSFRYAGDGDEMVCIDGIYLGITGEYSDSDGCGGCQTGPRRPTVDLIVFMLLIAGIGLFRAIGRK